MKLMSSCCFSTVPVDVVMGVKVKVFVRARPVEELVLLRLLILDGVEVPILNG